MDASFTFGRIRSKISETSQVAQYRFRQTTDVIEECLVAWRDDRAQQFAIAIEEPQRAAFEPVRMALAIMEESLNTLETQGNQVEYGVTRIQSDHQNVHQNCKACDNKLTELRYYIADARDRANQAKSTAAGVASLIAALGSPPI